MKSILILIFFLNFGLVNSQNKELSNAKDYFATYVKDVKSLDLEKANQWIEKAILIDNPLTNAETNFYLGLISKQYTETFHQIDKGTYILKATNAMMTSYNLNREAPYKEKLLKILQILAYDLYELGIKKFKENKNEDAYQSYKKILEIQKILAENKMNFDLVSPSGAKSSLSTTDIMNNLSVFCINSGKKEEAKAIFEQEVKEKPSPEAYAKYIQLCQQLNDTLNKDKYIQEGFKKYPKNEDMLVFAINRQLDKNNSDLALTYIDTAIKQKPNPKLFLVKAQIFETLAQFEKAEQIYKQALTIYPKDFDINYNLASSIFNSGLREINKQNEFSHKKGLEMVKEARNLFIKSKEIDSSRIDIDKLLIQVDSIK